MSACSREKRSFKSMGEELRAIETVPQTSRSDTQIRQRMHGMQRMHVHFF